MYAHQHAIKIPIKFKNKQRSALTLTLVFNCVLFYNAFPNRTENRDLFQRMYCNILYFTVLFRYNMLYKSFTGKFYLFTINVNISWKFNVPNTTVLLCLHIIGQYNIASPLGITHKQVHLNQCQVCVDLNTFRITHMQRYIYIMQNNPRVFNCKLKLDN